MSPGEARLWLRLKAMRAEGYHFRRQYTFRGYYLDFVCFSRRLVIEVDGAQHGAPDQVGHDELRDHVMRRERFEVLRISHGFVLRDIDSVMLSIYDSLAARPVFKPGE
jgi:very-short-patch-repair endonuclease